MVQPKLLNKKIIFAITSWLLILTTVSRTAVPDESGIGTLALGTHPRLGQQSAVRTATPNVLQRIRSYLFSDVVIRQEAMSTVSLDCPVKSLRGATRRLAPMRLRISDISQGNFAGPLIIDQEFYYLGTQSINARLPISNLRMSLYTYKEPHYHRPYFGDDIIYFQPKGKMDRLVTIALEAYRIIGLKEIILSEPKAEDSTIIISLRYDDQTKNTDLRIPKKI